MRDDRIMAEPPIASALRSCEESILDVTELVDDLILVKHATRVELGA
jgi:hypothetical protein